MAEFAIGTDVPTDQPTVEVTITAANPLRVGSHRFRLVVVDDSKNKSINLAEAVITVMDLENPTAILNAPKTVRFGQSFKLDGSDSSDVGGGKVVQYLWTYLGPA